ncbi:hypothetical protein OSH39_20765 [Mycobacterium ulcerans]|uniref:hypothetical protein n=1 Tax=Mycobacterium ulcerans TaxID=1809 RepID=UPI001E2BA81E|nr:hypothetical protein [Mycobacterium ulcerans]MEB3906708.1 hypothetical protein [Mycobacterium ulcerans]MEB3910855.1 hypothetical protein [Mycobacterium ulcerans]MEB3921110.1 hypothetical protein [Mycobacterium ulcerans]MEB3925215.1 hypothetical protein [Mycobacterium ulcerans]MEB3929370.1 hypothetical protein [Mycobacterium ulcerans]
MASGADAAAQQLVARVGGEPFGGHVVGAQGGKHATRDQAGAQAFDPRVGPVEHVGKKLFAVPEHVAR